MNADGSVSVLSNNRLEVHYYFGDKTHTMDAIVQNRCEHEFLGLLKQIAATFDSDIVIETEPIGDGGLRRWFRVVSRDEDKRATITTAVIAALATTIVVTPISTSISTAITEAAEVVFEDKEMNEIQKEKAKLEIEKLKLEIQAQKNTLERNNAIRKKKSNFYDNLEKYPKVQKVCFVIDNPNRPKTRRVKIVERTAFKEYILVTDDLEPVETDGATIEIISPVLKKGKYRWMGIYNGQAIPFHMNSTDFKSLIQNGTIEFRNGTSINCNLLIKRKVDNEGVEIVTGYYVTRVNSYFESDKPVETPEGKRHRQKKEFEKLQTNLFSDTALNESD